MPRRERRKCSFCAKTGHNKRTCSAYKRTLQTETVEPIIDDIVPVEPIETTSIPTEAATTAPIKKTGKKKLPVLVHAEVAHTHSPHIVDLTDEARSHALDSVQAFREAYEQTVGRNSVDFAHLIKRTKTSKRVSRKSAFTPVAHEAPSSQPAAPKPKKTWSLPTISFPSVRLPQFSTPSPRPLAFGAAMLAFLIAVPFPALGYIQDVQADSARVVAASTDGFVALKDSTVAAFTADISEAEQQLTRALESFSTATGILEGQHKTLKTIVSSIPVLGSQIVGREKLLAAGHHMALGNTYLVRGATLAQSPAEETLTDRLSILESHLDSSLVQYQAALTALASIPDSAIPKEYQTAADEFRLLFATFVDDIEDVAEFIGTVKLVLGEDGYRRYLVMFQNHHELRPTGGFMGSFAVLDVQKGRISWEIPGGGTYDVQGQLTLNYEPPLPLQLMNNKWEFQDANWWSHVPASAAVIEEMYENTRHATVDGVFFVNASVLESLLSVIGPVAHEAFAAEATDASIISELQTAKETYKPEENAPKAVLGELVPTLLSAIESSEGDALLQLLITAERALDQKDMQVYMHDESIQETFRSFGWTGELLETDANQDYVHVVRTNLQGQKSDAMIEESIDLDTAIQTDGTVRNTLRITRTHTGEVGVPHYGVVNIAHLRTYVPEGSTLVAARGFEFPPEDAFHVPSSFSEVHPLVQSFATGESVDRASGTTISNEFGKTLFGNWMIVHPGESKTVTLIYDLPGQLKANTIDDPRAGLPYTFVHQKQSGITSDFHHTIRFPEAWDAAWVSDDSIEVGGNFASFNATLHSDNYYGMVLRTEP